MGTPFVWKASARSGTNMPSRGKSHGSSASSASSTLRRRAQRLFRPDTMNGRSSYRNLQVQVVFGERAWEASEQKVDGAIAQLPKFLRDVVSGCHAHDDTWMLSGRIGR